MSTAEKRGGSGFGPLYRLPDEVQALLGTRVLDQVPEGPLRESVEGYLAMPESKRGPNSMARAILAEAIQRERERARRPYRPIDAYFDSPPIGHGESSESGGEASISGGAPPAEATREDALPASGAPTPSPHLGAKVPPMRRRAWTAPHPSRPPGRQQGTGEAVGRPGDDRVREETDPPPHRPSTRPAASAGASASAQPAPPVAPAPPAPPAPAGAPGGPQRSATREDTAPPERERAAFYLGPVPKAGRPEVADEALPAVEPVEAAEPMTPVEPEEASKAVEPMEAAEPSGSEPTSRGLRFEFVETVEPDANSESEATAPAAAGPSTPKADAAVPMDAPATESTNPPAPVAPADSDPSWRQVLDGYALADARRDLMAGPAGWRTGFEELDATGFYLLPDHLYMVHAPHGGGKTALLVELLTRHLGQRRVRPGDFWPALMVSARESRAETYARLLLHVAQGREHGEGPATTPTGPAVREWVRSGLAPTADHALWFEAAARHLDEAVRDGSVTLADAGRTGVGVDALIAWFESGRAEADGGPSMILIDDAHRLRPPPELRAASPERQRLGIVRRLRHLAGGGACGQGCSAPIVFSVPTAAASSMPESERVYAEELAAEATGILRIDQTPGAAATVTVEKNAGGPKGWMFPVPLYTTGGPQGPDRRVTPGPAARERRLADRPRTR